MGNQGGRSGDYGSTGMGGDVNAGPHDSKLGNKMDPRVDSDMGKPSQALEPKGQAK
jgi:hypothetical protein